MKLAAARIFVRDLQEARSFYGQALGLRMLAAGTGSDHLVFSAETCDLVVERIPDDAPADEQALVGRFTGLSFLVTDIDLACRGLAGRGVDFTSPPERQAWGGIIATLRDPSGNELQLVQYPGGP